MVKPIVGVAILLAGLVSVAWAQYQPALAATNYQTNDGQQRTETRDGDGNVRGEYSYVDPTGRTIKVKYSAGKDGFKVEGDHLPRAPQPVAPQQAYQPAYQPAHQPYYQPAQASYNPAPQYQSAHQQLQNFPGQQNNYQQPPQYNSYQAPPQQQYNPFQHQQPATGNGQGHLNQSPDGSFTINF